MKTHSVAIVSLLIAAALFFAINILAGASLRSTRVDLTQHSIYTLSAGSRRIASSSDEPISLTLYFSQKQASAIPSLRTYGRRVREMLEEFAIQSHGKIRLKRVDPAPFSEEEDDATAAGVAGVQAGNGSDKIYFGLVGENAADRQEVIPFFDPAKEEFLEYDVSRLIYTLASNDKPVIGLMSTLPIEGSPANPALGPRSQRPAWEIVSQMRSLFDVRTVAPTAQRIPDEVDVLMIVHPKELPEQTQFAIDQFVLGGGKAIVFVDPLCESDVPPGAQQNPMQLLSANRSSSLPRLLGAWGVELVEGKVVADRRFAQRVVANRNGGRQTVDDVAWLALTDDAIDKEDVVTSTLDHLNLASAGALKTKEGATTTVSTLLRSSQDSMLLDQMRIAAMTDPQSLLRDFSPDKERYTIAVRIGGDASTAFPDGPPGDESADDDEANSDDAKTDDAADGKGAVDWLTESAVPVNVIVVADCDFLADQFWIRRQMLGSLNLGALKIASNGDFVLGAIDNLTGSNDLISIRARGRFTRPFDRVLEIQKAADKRFLDEEQALQSSKRDMEQKILDLQQKRGDSGGGVIIMSDEQKAEYDKYQEELLQTRKRLREVQLSRSRDIEKLGARLKFLDIALLPICVSFFAVGLGGYRALRRKTDRAAASST